MPVFTIRRAAAVVLVTLSGCAHQPGLNNGTTRFIAAQPVVQAPAIVQAPLDPPPPEQLVRIPSGSPYQLSGIAATYRARESATQIPVLSGYVNAVMQYSYEPGEVYRVDTSPDYVTSVLLEKGEQLISKASGDTARWLLGNTVTGGGADQQVVILLKPEMPNLHTNIVLTTTRRVYYLDVFSHPGDAYQSGISWTYPDDELAQMEAQASRINQDNGETVGTGLSLANLDFNYRLRSVQGDRPDWFPLQVFDDGTKTYIRFPNNLGTTDAPPLFILEQGNRADLVNYRVKGDYYIVDRLISRAQLRYGEAPQTIVEIDRVAGPAGMQVAGW